MPNSVQTMPFGKYKGRPIAEVVATDRKYIDWCMSQPNIRDSIGDTVINIIHVSSPSEDKNTPVHNRLQASFFDKEKIVDTVVAIGLKPAYVEREETDDELVARIVANIDSDDFSDNERQLISKYKSRIYSISLTDVVERFYRRRLRVDGGENRSYYYPERIFIEESGWDVVATGILVEDTYNAGQNNDTVSIHLELKPSLGDDFPSVLRDVKKRISLARRWGHGKAVVVCDRYDGEVPFETVVDMYASSGVHLLRVDQIKNRHETNTTA